VATTRAGGLLAGEGRVHLVRTGGGAGPNWGAYVVLYAMRISTDAIRECLIAATSPDRTDPALRLQTEHPYGPVGNARKPLWDYAAACLPARANGSGTQYEQALAKHLPEGAHSAWLTGRGRPARWEMTTEHLVSLPLVAGSTHGYAGYHTVRVGRLHTVQLKSP
jgi:hypothetical protein